MAKVLFYTTHIITGDMALGGRNDERTTGNVRFCFPLSIREVVGISPADIILCHCLYPSHSSKIQLQGVVLKSDSGVGSIHGWQSSRGEPDPSPAERRHTDPGGVGQSSAEQWLHVGLNQGRRMVPKTTGDAAQRVQILGVCQSLFSISLGSGIGKPMVGSTRHLVFAWETTWCCVGRTAAILSLSWGPCRLNLQAVSSILPCPGSHTELSQGGEQLLCVKHLLFLCTFIIYIAAVTVCSLFQGCLISVNCYLDPESLSLSISYQKGQREVQRLIWNLISSWC